LTGHLYDSVKVYVQCNEIEALPKRQGTEIRSKDAMAPVWVKSVATPDAAASPNKGGFSKTRCLSTSRPAGRKPGVVLASVRNRFSGHLFQRAGACDFRHFTGRQNGRT